MKTLWLGCSHSLGVYNENDTCMNTYGIPYHVSNNFNQENWKIVSCRGQGIIEFSSILTYLDRENLLNFDNVIIQLTTEPRLRIYSDPEKKWESLRQYLADESSLTHQYDLLNGEKLEVAYSNHVTDLYYGNKDRFSKSNKLALFKMCESIACAFETEILDTHLYIHCKNIINLLEKNNINLYTFCFQRNEIITLDADKLLSDYNILQDSFSTILDTTPTEDRNRYYVGGWGHPKKEGVIYVSNVVTDALKKSGFEG